MHDKKLAAQLIQNALLLEEKQREELLELLARPEVSEEFVNAIIRTIGEEQEQFARIIASMSDEEATRLGMSVVQTEVEETQKASSQEAQQTGEDAEILLDSSLS